MSFCFPLLTLQICHVRVCWAEDDKLWAYMNDFPSVIVNLHVTSTISLKRSAWLSEQRSHSAQLPLFSFLGGHSSSALCPALYVSVVSKYSCYKYHRRGWIPGGIMSWWQRHRCNRGCEIHFPCTQFHFIWMMVYTRTSLGGKVMWCFIITFVSHIDFCTVYFDLFEVIVMFSVWDPGLSCLRDIHWWNP